MTFAYPPPTWLAPCHSPTGPRRPPLANAFVRLSSPLPNPPFLPSTSPLHLVIFLPLLHLPPRHRAASLGRVSLVSSPSARQRSSVLFLVYFSHPRTASRCNLHPSCCCRRCCRCCPAVRCRERQPGVETSNLPRRKLSSARREFY